DTLQYAGTELPLPARPRSGALLCHLHNLLSLTVACHLSMLFSVCLTSRSHLLRLPISCGQPKRRGIIFLYDAEYTQDQEIAATDEWCQQVLYPFLDETQLIITGGDFSIGVISVLQEDRLSA